MVLMPRWGIGMIRLDHVGSGMSATPLVVAGEISLDIWMVMLSQREQIYEPPLLYALILCSSSGHS